MNTQGARPGKGRRAWRFLVSLPERTVRAGAATAGGAVYQVSEVLLPRGLRRSKLYQATIARMLRITVEGVGGVNGAMPPDTVPVRKLVVRKAAGNVVEVASIVAVGWSPLWLLAAAADLTGGTQAYLRALTSELRTAGLLTDDSGITSFEDLLGHIERSSAALADTIDLPPLNLTDVRASWDAFRRQEAGLPGHERQAAIYADLEQASKAGGQSLLEVSSLVAASAVRAGIQLGNVHIFHYYQEALGAILREGLSAYAQRVAHPYLSTAAGHLDPNASTYTERALVRVEQWWRDRSNPHADRPPGPPTT